MSSLTDDQFATLRNLVRERAGICLDEGKDYLVRARLRELASRLGLPGEDDLLARLMGTDGERLRNEIVDAMTTNETSFFRDRHPFEALRSHVLPDLLERRRLRGSLTIWCGASSTGQEPYSLAMLLLDEIPDFASWRIRILATDYSERVLARASSGVYSDTEVHRGLTAEQRARFFEHDDGEWHVRPQVRRLVEFRQMNLNAAWPALPQADLVFMRNVLIYFDVADKTRILGGVRDLLAPDGLLCLGAAETMFGIRDDFEPVRHGETTFYSPSPASSH